MNISDKTRVPSQIPSRILRRIPVPVRWAPWLVAALLVALLFGTQMPGAWKDAALQTAGMPWQVTKVAHFTIFCAIAFVLSCLPLAWPLRRVLMCSLALALLTEGLQFFAANRQPTLADVGIDMAGALVGVWLSRRKLNADA